MIVSLTFVGALVALDQYFKWLATKYLMGQAAKVIIPGVVGLKYTQNTGAAFSMLSNGTTLLIVITTVALLVMAYFLFMKKVGTPFERFCFILIFAGGVGNLIDRVIAGFVVDYFELLFMNFAIFNFADILICVGVGLFIAYTFYTELKIKKGKV